MILNLYSATTITLYSKVLNDKGQIEIIFRIKHLKYCSQI